MMANAGFDGDLAVALLGTEGRHVRLDLAQLLWPDVKRFGAEPRKQAHLS